MMEVSSLTSSFSSHMNRFHGPISSISVKSALISSHPFYHFPSRLISCSKFCSSSSALYGTSLCSQKLRSLSRLGKRCFEINAVFEKFTERAIKVVIFSQIEAKSLGKDMVFTQHLLLGLVAEDDGYLGSGITIDMARNAVLNIWHPHQDAESDSEGSNDSSASSHVPFSISTKRVFEAAVEYSKTTGHNFVSPEHISIGLFTVDDGSAGRVLKRLGVDVNHLAAEAVSRLEGELAKDGRGAPSTMKSMQGKPLSGRTTTLRSSGKRKEKTTLDQFCLDLTARASDGLIDPVIGRETEIKRTVQILCRRTKNNPILLGESGVGKTAIAEGLAIRIAQAEVPVFLMTKRIMSLDIGLLLAGAKERGELESRVTMLVRDIVESGNIILFIDEVHTLVGSGGVERGSKGSGLGIANLLKPALGRGKLQCMASTTTDEYRMHFEKDKALARRFQPVLVNEPSQEDAVKILLGLQEKYEAHHKCRFTMEAISAAVHLSARYIPDRHLPDKAIDLIDEAGSKARIEFFKRKREQNCVILSKSPEEYWKKIRSVQALHNVGRVRKLKNHKGASSKIKNSKGISECYVFTKPDDEPTVGPDDIAAVASAWSGIPVQQLTSDERMRLTNLDEQLKKRVVGQEEAVAAISRAVKRSRVGLKNPKRPIAVMLFCGPTGVGKTELTKALASCYFGSETAMLRLDMSEYMERHTVSKLIGSPPGYIGYGEGGVLTEAIRRRPFTVVLLDEIEKAHPDVFNILLQLFEDGHLTDSQGRRVSFKNALIVMTSNVGSTSIARGRESPIGFLTPDDKSTSYAGLKTLVMEELKAYLRPEFLNRIDEVLVFHPLKKNQMLEILGIMVEEVKQRLASFGISMVVTDSIKNLICQQGYDRAYGARPLRRAVTQFIEDPVSEAMLIGNFKTGDTIVIDLDESGKPFVINQSVHSVILPDKRSLL